MLKALASLSLGSCLILIGYLVSGDIHAQVHGATAKPATADIVWNFDETQGLEAHDSAGNVDDQIHGFWRRVPGVKGNALEFDGYTTYIARSANEVPRLGNAFTSSAWVALNNYPWNWVPIVDQSEGRQVGYFFGIDAFGHVGFDVTVSGVWQELTTSRRLPLKKWAHITASYDGAKGLSIFIDGTLAGSLKTTGEFWQARSADLYVGRVRVPQLPFPAWLSHPRDRIMYSLDGDLDEVEIEDRSISEAQDKAEVFAANAPQGDVISHTVLPSGPPGAGPFGAMYATLKYVPSWDRLRRIGPDSDVVVRFDRSPMRLVFWQGTNYIPAWVTENGKWYTDEFLEFGGPGCPGAGDCEPMSDKQSRYSRVSIIQSSPARAIIHWRYALAEARKYQGAHKDPLSGWFDWADENWTVYPDGVAVRKQVLHSSAVSTSTFEWQETIVINGPGQRPEDNIQLDALTLENMAGETASYKWEPKKDQTSFADPKTPPEMKRPPDANIQIVHLKSKESPFQIVSPLGVSIVPYTYVGQSSLSTFHWWNHWPVAQIDSSGRPAIAADRASSSSLSHIYWAPYARTADTETKLLLCGLTTQNPASLLPLARSWLKPPPAKLEEGDARDIEYDPTQRAYVVHRAKNAQRIRIAIAISASAARPLVDPAFVIENWSGSAHIKVTINGKKPDFAVRAGIEHHLEGDSLILYLPFKAIQPVQLRVASTT